MQEATQNRGGSNKALAALSSQSNTTDFIPQAGDDFIATPAIVELTNRALAYISIGYAVHLSGPAGTGKTTLALHIASQIGRRCTLLHGDDELRGSDLLGKDAGYRRQSVRDNYVSSILKTEETVSLMWSSNRLTTACEQGHTVIYDEFTRSPAAANNAFLSILEEGILSIPSSGQDKSYVRVHPEFRAIFTSNPEEYVGVHKSQDALLDRMITLEVCYQDRETEIAIVQAKSARSPEEATAIVEIIRSLRERLGSKNGPTIRAALAIAKILDYRKASVSANDPIFMTTCQDVLFYNATRQATKPFTRSDLEGLIRSVLTNPSRKSAEVKKPTTSGAHLPSTTAAPKRDVAKEPVPPTASKVQADQQPEKLELQEPEKAVEKTVEKRMDVVIADISEGINDLGKPSIAEIALSATNDSNQRIQERFSVNAKTSDETNSDDHEVNSNRRLPRPPSFESIPVGAAVSQP